MKSGGGGKVYHGGVGEADLPGTDTGSKKGDPALAKKYKEAASQLRQIGQGL